MLKGILEGLILEIINKEEIYGYDIVRKLNQYKFEGISEGTVYTILVRLEKNNLVHITRKPSDQGPPRKFYTLNERGKQGLKDFWARWDYLSTRIKKIR